MVAKLDRVIAVGSCVLTAGERRLWRVVITAGLRVIYTSRGEHITVCHPQPWGLLFSWGCGCSRYMGDLAAAASPHLVHSRCTGSEG